MRRKSSSPKDQLEAPLTGSRSCESRFHTAHDGFGPAAQHWLTLPREIISQKTNGFHSILTGEKAQCGQATQRAGAEQVPPVVGEAPLSQEPANGAAHQNPTGKYPRTGTHQPTSCRA